MPGPRHIDASIGDPLFAFDYALEYAWKQMRPRAHQYDNYGNYERDVLRYFSKRLIELGITVQNWYKDIPPSNMLTTMGITGGYALVMRHLGEQARQFNELTGRKEKPVIIIPEPTYGLFYSQPQANGFEIVTIPRDPENGWSLDPEKLDRLITEINASGDRRVMAFYDSNPNNPTGRIRGKEETEALAKVLDKHGWYEEKEALSMQIPREHRQAFHKLPYDIQIIDDMAYAGLEYGDQKPYPFSSYTYVNHNCYTLLGGSKVGLASIRGGLLVCGSEKQAEALKQIQKDNHYFPPSFTLHALEALFSSKAETPEENHPEERKKHLAKLNAAHEFNGKLLKAMLCGMGSCDVTEDEKRQMIEIVARVNESSLEDAQARLVRPVEGINLVSNPEAGFFHLLDFSHLNGHQFSYYLSNSWDPPAKAKEITNALDIVTIFDAAQCRLCLVDFKEQPYLFRVSYALPVEDIVGVANRLESGLRYVAKPGEPVRHSRPTILENGLNALTRSAPGAAR